MFTRWPKKFKLGKLKLSTVARLFIATCLFWSFFAPHALNVLLIGNLLFGLFVFYLRFKLLPVAQDFSLPSVDVEPSRLSEREPFVSLHMPICNEPPELTLKALRCLDSLDYNNYEVVVLSNNTPDPNLWLPLRRFCESRSKFKFMNAPKIKGYKAGALNLCLKLTDPRAKYVMTVDADYCLRPSILKEGIGSLRQQNLSYLQFPQSYSNGGRDSGLEMEYAHFFQVFMRGGSEKNATLLTGTLSLLNKEALLDCGGWAEESVTEDAKTSLNLLLAGYRGGYSHCLMGEGVMPTDMDSLRKQRHRWAFGNAQTFFSLNLAQAQKLGREKLPAIFLQLTAWHEFMFIPFACLLMAALQTIYPSLGPEIPPQATTIAATTIGGFLILKLLFFVKKLRPMVSSGQIVGIYLAHLGLALETNLGWVKSLTGRAEAFIRTNKFIAPSKTRDILPHILLAATAFACGVLLFKLGDLNGLLALGFGGATFLGALSLQKEFKNMNEKNMNENRESQRLK